MRYVSHITLAVLSTFVAANLLAGCPSNSHRYQRAPSSQGYGPSEPYQNYSEQPQDAYGYPQQSSEIMAPDFHPRRARGYPVSHRDQNFSNPGFHETVYYNQHSQGAGRPEDSSFSDYSSMPDYMSQQQPYYSTDENSARFAAPVSKSNYRLKPRGFNPELIRDESGYNGNNNPYTNNGYSQRNAGPSYSSGYAYRPNYQSENNYPMNRPSYSSERPNPSNGRYFDETSFNNTLANPIPADYSQDGAIPPNSQLNR